MNEKYPQWAKEALNKLNFLSEKELRNYQDALIRSECYRKAYNELESIIDKALETPSLK